MTTLTEDFNLVEKLAIVQTVDALIMADGTVHEGEINALCKLMRHIDFDSNFIIHARNIGPEKGWSILQDMPYDKKEALILILEEMAISDDHVHEKEAALIASIIANIANVQKVKAAK